MSWLLLFFYIELGVVSQNNWMMYSTPYIESSHQYYTEFAMRAEVFNVLFVEGKVKTRAYHHDSYMFTPFTDEYTAGFGLQFDNIEIGFRHLCTHPVIPYIKTVAPEIKYEGGYEELYIRMEVKR